MNGCYHHDDSDDEANSHIYIYVYIYIYIIIQCVYVYMLLLEVFISYNMSDSFANGKKTGPRRVPSRRPDPSQDPWLSKNVEPPRAGWLMMENPNRKWMTWGYPHDLGNVHFKKENPASKQEFPGISREIRGHLRDLMGFVGVPFPFLLPSPWSSSSKFMIAKGRRSWATKALHHYRMTFEVPSK